MARRTQKGSTEEVRARQLSLSPASRLAAPGAEVRGPAPRSQRRRRLPLTSAGKTREDGKNFQEDSNFLPLRAPPRRGRLTLSGLEAQAPCCRLRRPGSARQATRAGGERGDTRAQRGTCPTLCLISVGWWLGQLSVESRRPSRNEDPCGAVHRTTSHQPLAELTPGPGLRCWWAGSDAQRPISAPCPRPTSSATQRGALVGICTESAAASRAASSLPRAPPRQHSQRRFFREQSFHLQHVRIFSPPEWTTDVSGTLEKVLLVCV